MSPQGDLESYVSKQSINSDVVIACIDVFLPEVNEPTVIIMEKAPIHTSRAMQAKREKWKQRGIYLFELPSYSPKLNLIEMLWRFIKCQWLEIESYQSWQRFVESLEEILSKVGRDPIINFA
jgi:transposase